MDSLGSIESRYHKAEYAIEASQYGEAVSILEQLVIELPDEPLFLWRLGYLLCDLHEAGRAIDYFKRAILIDPNSAPAWGGLGQAYMELAKWNEAEHALRKRLQIKPGPHFFVFLAVVLHAKGDLEGAIDSCKKALELDPNYDEAFFNLGVYYHLLKRNDEARKVFAKAVELDPAWANQIEGYTAE
jgi:tetratricopeptide (TPR) repeat protein